jgi:acyl-CoA synthetase (NDP forming)
VAIDGDDVGSSGVESREGPPARNYGFGVPRTTLSETACKQLPAGHGVPVLPARVVAAPYEAVAAAEIGLPVVAKPCGGRSTHKTERGLVRLGPGAADTVRVAATELLAAATPGDGAVGVLVAPMVRASGRLWYPSPTRAVTALGHLYRYARFLARHR